MKDFVVSDTALEAEWIKDKGFTRIYHCSNCKDSHSIERTTKLTSYCGKCGARMKNSQWVTVEYDYGF
jgi:Zn-finger protein